MYMNIFEKFFFENGIEYFGSVEYDSSLVINSRLLERTYQYECNTIIAFLVPYYVGKEKSNISEYAIARDYHIYFSQIYADLRSGFSEQYPAHHIGCYADASPFNERKYAKRAGLGVIGRNGLIINPKYGSYVFIGTIVTDMTLELIPHYADGARTCTECGACLAACPSDGDCLSYLTQKKGELSDNTKRLIKQNACVWGCDICQNVCPANREIPVTNIEFFRINRTPYLTSEILSAMSDDEFSKRAYAWKGRDTIMRNVKVFENNE